MSINMNNYKMIKAATHYIYKLRYRRNEGWDDSDPTNQFFIRMINKFYNARNEI